jgi:hypothetical protein
MRRIALFVVIAACGGGPGRSSGVATDAYEPPGNSRDPTGSTRDPAAGGRETPPSSQDPAPGSQDPAPGAGGGGPVAECLPCADYECSGVLNGQDVSKLSVRLRSQDGACVTEDQRGNVVTVTSSFACGGKITDGNGVAIGTWTRDSSGAISVSIQTPGLATHVTCVVHVEQPPQPGGVRDAG